MLRVAPMRYTDCDALMPLFVEMHAESKYADQPLHGAVVCDTFKDVGGNIGGFIAYNDDKPIGFCAASLTGYFFRHGKLAMDLGVFVRKPYRHTTAFPRLLHHLEQWAHAEGADALICGITAPHDVDIVRKAYEKMGYTSIGVSMRKEL